MDNEEFKKMWLDVEVTPKQIAEHFGHSVAHVHYKRNFLGLPPKGTLGFGLGQHQKQVGERSAKRLLKNLREQGGFCSFHSLQSQFAYRIIARLRHEGRLFIVRFNLGRGSGVNMMRKKQDLIFTEQYMGKCFVCDSRTAVVRLMGQALKKPETEHIQKTTTSFLRSYLTKAERYAVLWKLGKRNWDKSQVKSSIQIDGILKPTKRCMHCGMKAN